MNNSLRDELDAIHEELDALRQAADEMELLITAFDKLGDVFIPSIPNDKTIKVLARLERFMDFWCITRHRRESQIARSIQAWIDLLESSAKVHDPDGFAAHRRSGFHEVSAAQEAFDKSLQSAFHRLHVVDGAPPESHAESPDEAGEQKTDE